MAQAALANIDPLSFFKTENDIEMGVLRLVAKRAIDWDAKYREDLANRIIGALSKSIERGKQQRKSQSTTPTR